MAGDARAYFRYYGQKIDGRKGMLLDTLGFYSNHSAMPMHVVGETAEDIDFVLNQAVRKLLAVMLEEHKNKAIGGGYQKAVLMMIAYCLRKYKPWRILYVGGQPRRWWDMFATLLCKFHPESKIYWLSQTDTVPGMSYIEMKMPFEELLLPQQAFDIVLLDDTDEQLLIAMNETVGLSLRLQGLRIVLSKRRDILNVLAGDKAERYALGVVGKLPKV